MGDMSTNKSINGVENAAKQNKIKFMRVLWWRGFNSLNLHGNKRSSGYHGWYLK